MAASPTAPSDLLVACLCAAWCGVCRDYRAAFGQAASRFPGARFVWIDIEDHAAWIDPLEVDDFPTLLIVAGTEPCFFGPVTPQRETLERLLRSPTRARAGVDAAVQAFAARLLAQPRLDALTLQADG